MLRWLSYTLFTDADYTFVLYLNRRRLVLDFLVLITSPGYKMCWAWMRVLSIISFICIYLLIIRAFLPMQNNDMLLNQFIMKLYYLLPL